MSAATKIDTVESTRDLPVILLVDEHRVTADIEMNYFVSSGFHVLVATSVAEVRDVLAGTHVDLLMIDVGFAREKGLDAVRLAKRVTRNAALKILVTSVVGLPEVRKNAEAAGADRFLVKPAPRPKVLKEIKALTSQRARDSERIRQELQVEAMLKDGKALKARSLDVSEDGIHLATDGAKPAIGVGLALSIHLPEDVKPLEIDGVVVRHTQEGFGVKFVTVTRTAKRQLDKFLLAHSMESRATQYYL